MEPASSIIAKLGGAAEVSRITGTDSATPYRWQSARDQGGTDGWIPIRHHRSLLEYAQRNKIPLSAEEFLPTFEMNSNKKRRSAL